MKNCLKRNVLAFVIASMVCQNGWGTYASKEIAVDDIEFKLYGHQFESLQEKFAGFVKKPRLEDDIIPNMLNGFTSELPVLGNVLPIISNYIEKHVEYRANLESELKKAEIIIKEINDRIAEYHIYDDKIKLAGLHYHLGKSTNKNDLNYVDTELYKLILFFADSGCPLVNDPTRVASVILPLTVFAELLMKLEKLEAERSGEPEIPTEIPCKLADTIKNYFIPALFQRLDEIDVQTDQYNFEKENKFVHMHETLKAPFNPDLGSGGDDEQIKYLRCARHDGNRTVFDRDVEIRFPRKNKKGSANFVGWQSYELNMHDTRVTLLKDNLGNKNEYFVGETGAYAKDYFSLVRHRLEKEFGIAYQKIQQFCTVQRNIRTTGDGWLTVKLGAVLAKNLKTPEDICDGVGWGERRFCDPYVKLVLKPPESMADEYENEEHKSDAYKNSPGWTIIDKTFHFKKSSWHATMHSEIYDMNTSDDEKLFETDKKIGYMLHNAVISDPYSMSDNDYNLSKLIMVSIWRDEISNEDHTSNSN